MLKNLICLALLFSTVLSNTRIVPDDFFTISDAITASSDGDTVFVRNGIYIENIAFTESINSLSLIGESPDSTKLIGSGINIMCNNKIIISNFSLIQIESSSAEWDIDYVPNIGVDTGCKATIFNCTFKNFAGIDNAYNYGGEYPSFVVLYNGSVDDYVNLINCKFDGDFNTRVYGTGIKTRTEYDYSFNGQVRIYNSIFDSLAYVVDNSIEGSIFGGGSDMGPATVQMTNCILNDVGIGFKNTEAVYNSILIDIDEYTAGTGGTPILYSMGSQTYYSQNDYTFSLIANEISGVGIFFENIAGDPLFNNYNFDNINFDLASNSYDLLENSPCINAGYNPTPVFNDADGTVNDIGIYGGPFSWGWEYPSTPILRSNLDTLKVSSLEAGETIIESIVLYNQGNGYLEIDSVIFSGTNGLFSVSLPLTILEGDSAIFPITIYNNAGFEFDIQTMSLKYHNYNLFPLGEIERQNLDLVICAGFDDVTTAELSYDDNDPDSYFSSYQASWDRTYINKFNVEYTSVLNQARLFVGNSYSYSWDDGNEPSVDILLFSSEEDSFPDPDELLRINNVQISPDSGWQEFNIHYQLDPGIYYLGFKFRYGYVEVGLDNDYEGDFPSFTFNDQNEVTSSFNDDEILMIRALISYETPDPLASFDIIHPTINDTIQINSITEQLINFSWHSAGDTSNDINYLTTISLDYFGNNYSLSYESSDSVVSVSTIEWAELMSNLGLHLWTLSFQIDASNGFETISSDVGEFVFENLTMSPPGDFDLIFPSYLDTLDVDLLNEVIFFWERGNNFQEGIYYITTLEVTGLGGTYSREYASTDTLVTISTAYWKDLMISMNLSDWDMQYSVSAYVQDSTLESSSIGQFVFHNSSLSIKNDITPFTYRLHQNYPNPFNPITIIRYELPEDSFVNVTVYDMLGNVVNNLVNANQSSGYKSIQWNAANNQGEPVSAGVYLYSIEAGKFRQTKKMILLK